MTSVRLKGRVSGPTAYDLKAECLDLSVTQSPSPRYQRRLARRQAGSLSYIAFFNVAGCPKAFQFGEKAAASPGVNARGSGN
jgi:hypothetical protein